jgi:hypothetical protein
MLTFLHELIEQGRVTVALTPEQAVGEELVLAISHVDRKERLALAGDTPALLHDVAIWSLGMIENACRFLAYREFEGEDIAAVMNINCPDSASPEACYSADLFLRYLPDVIKLARGMGQADPLVKHLVTLAAQWPLSSVGVAGLSCEAKEVEAFIGHPSLRQLYLDRIAASGDVSRLGVAAVRRDMRAAIGNYPQLAPRMAEALGALPE